MKFKSALLMMEKYLTFLYIKKHLRRLSTQREQILFLWQNYSRNSCLYKLHQNETKIVEGKKERFFSAISPHSLKGADDRTMQTDRQRMDGHEWRNVPALG